MSLCWWSLIFCIVWVDGQSCTISWSSRWRTITGCDTCSLRPAMSWTSRRFYISLSSPKISDWTNVNQLWSTPGAVWRCIRICIQVWSAPRQSHSLIFYFLRFWGRTKIFFFKSKKKIFRRAEKQADTLELLSNCIRENSFLWSAIVDFTKFGGTDVDRLMTLAEQKLKTLSIG